ncbi:MAG: glycosyltransferase family 2 protein [Leptolyngbya sp. SIOISBB]|nr:glycosyltransferase family 2 protein [Leptolyngbya sp. SIOISBB]
MKCSTSIILIIFRRPLLTQEVFSRIQAVKPSKLFVVADGSENEEERIFCEQARAVTEQVDWDCEVYRNYADTNLGCRQRVSSGVTWAFEHVEEAIVLEDDCVPDPSFFYYCENLLSYYREDKRVMVISGNNFQDGCRRGNDSYYFSKYNHCWGWATWRRAWKHWEFNPDRWIQFRDLGLMKTVCIDFAERIYWTDIFNEFFLENKFDSWAYAWTFACWSHGGLTALPNCNLISNIGFDEDATHTRKKSRFANMITESIDEIRHPDFVCQDVEADFYTFQNHFEGNLWRRFRRHLRRIKRRLL